MHHLCITVDDFPRRGQPLLRESLEGRLEDVIVARDVGVLEVLPLRDELGLDPDVVDVARPARSRAKQGSGIELVALALIFVVPNPEQSARVRRA